MLSASLGFAVEGSQDVFQSGGFAVATDSAGDSYMLATNAVYKYAPDGTQIWATTFTPTKTTFTGPPEGIALDGSGNVYIAGTYGGGITPVFGSTTLPTGSTTNVFLAKLDSNGNFLWADGFVGAGGDYNNDSIGLAADSAGNTYLDGTFQGVVSFGNVGLTGNGSQNNAFVTKVDPQGNVAWAKGFVGTSSAALTSSIDARGIAIDGNGDIYATGGFTGMVDVNSTQPGTNVLTDSNFFNNLTEYVLKLDNNGDTLWSQQAQNFTGVFDNSVGTAIAVDNSGNVYTTGSYEDLVNFDVAGSLKGQLSNNVSPNDLFENGFVLKLSARGQFDWADALNVNVNTLLFAHVQPHGIAVDAFGNVYTTGNFAGTVDFDPGPATYDLSASGFYDGIYVTAFDSQGRFGWAAMAGGNNGFWDAGNGIAASGDGAIHVAGTFYNTVDFDPGPGVYALTPAVIGTGSFNWKLTQPLISGTVWDDSDDRDGVLEAAVEPGVPGAVVNLYASSGGAVNPSTSPLVATTVTDSSGHYKLLPLTSSPLQFVVQVRPPVGFGFTSENAGTKGQIQSNVNLTGMSGVFSPINSVEIDAGLIGTRHPFGWALPIATLGSTAATSILTDAAGNIYVAGSFQGTQDFDPGPATYLVTSGNFGNAINDFVAKYTPAGALMWVRTAASKASEVGPDPNSAPKLALDPTTGDVDVLLLVTGQTDFNVSALGTNLVTPVAGASSTVVLWSVDPLGNFVSARSMVGGQADSVGGLAIDSSGNVYLAGTYINTADFDPGPGLKYLTSQGGDDIFVTKLTADGVLAWTQTFGGTGDDQVKSLAVDSSGNVVITGSIQGTASFGSIALRGAAAAVSTAFVAKLNGATPPAFVLPPPAPQPMPGGAPFWVVALPGFASSVGNGVAVNPATNEIYDTGTAYSSSTPGSPGTAYFWKLTSNGGSYQPAMVPSTGDSSGTGVVVDSSGNIWATGTFSGTANFDLYATNASVDLTAVGAHDAYLMKVGFNGFGLLQADQFGGPGDDTVNAVAVDGTGHVYLAGSSQGPANLDPGLASLDTFDIGKAGEQDDFVARLNPPPADVAPSFTLAPSVTVLEDAPVAPLPGWASNIVPGTVGAPLGALGDNDQSLNFVVTNDNPSLFSLQPGIDPAGTLTFTPALNQSGTATVTVTLRDDSGLTATKTFTINVQFVDLPPSFVVNPTLTKGGDQTVNEDSGTHVVPSWAASISAGPGIGDNVAPNNSLQFLIADTDPSLYAPGGFPTIDATTGNLSYTLAPDASGTDTLTVTLKDSGLVTDGGTAASGVDTSAPLTFHINAQFVNDPPTFTPGAQFTTLSDQSNSNVVSEDAGPQTFANWATNISPGEGANEQYQKAGLYFTLGNSDPELFSVLPAIDPATGNLTFTPNPDVVGAGTTDTVTAVLHDTAGTANGGVNQSAPVTLYIKIAVDDDPPTFTAGAAQSLRADTSGQQSVAWATNISPGPSNEASQASTLKFAITNIDHPELFSVPPAIDPATGKLTYTLAPGEPAFVNGVPPAAVTAHFNVVLQDDGGAANNGADSTPAPLAITVGYTDIAPSFTMVGDPTAVDETTGPAVQHTDPNWATNINKGAPDESWQTLNFNLSTTILSGDADLFNPAKGAVPPAIDPTTGNLTFTPAPFLSGVANISVTLADNGVSLNGINYGGVGTSATKTFRITVNPVNTPPSFQLSSNDFNVDEDTQGIQSVAQFATSISPGLGPDEAGQKLTFLVVPKTTADATEAATLFAIPPSIDPTTGALSYELEPNVDGTVNYDVTLQDNGGGNDTSSAVPLAFNVNFKNDPPVLTGLSDQVLLENTAPSTSTPPPVQSIPITLSPGLDANEQQQHWTVTVANDNAGLFASGGAPTIRSSPQVSAPLTTGQGTTAGTFDYQLAPDRSGVANITVTLSDDGVPDQGTPAADSSPLTITQNFRIVVTPVNTPPEFQINPSALDPTTQAVTALEDAGAQTLPNFLTGISPGADPAEVGQKVSFQVALQSSTNPGLFVIPPAIDANGQLTYTLAPDQNGSAVVSVVAHDDGGTLNGGVDTSQPQLFTINALYVNDPPTFTSSGAQTVNENAGVQRVPLWATNMSPGEGANEIGQTLHFVLAPNDAGSSSLFLIQPTIDSSGNLLYSPAPFANGTANFTVTLVDNGGTANGGQNTSTPHPLSITINPVNAPPSFAEGLDQTVDEDSGPHVVPNWATAIKDGQGNPPNQPLTFSVQPADAQSAALFSAGPSIDSSGTLSFTPAPLAFGVGTFTATLSDGGSTANGGQSTSVAETFHITVNRIDHAPTVANALANPTVNENPPNATLFASLANVFNDVDIPLGDKLTLSMAGPNGGSSNPSLVTATLSGTDPAKATLRLNYQPNQSGTAVIDLRATDQSGKSVDDKINVTVLAVNQAPSFTARGDVQVNSSGGTVVLPLWATNISAGPPNESGQKLTFNVVDNTNPALFQEPPSVSAASGSLTFATRPGVTGTAAITLVLQDDGGTANGGQDTSQPRTFNITVGAVPVVPVAQPDSYLLGLGASDSATAANGVLANDTPSGNLTAKLVQGPAHGTLTLNADGSFTYVKSAGFDGIDQFSYEAVSGSQASSPVTVQITSYEASIVDKVYQQVLGRPADSAGLQYWTAQIENGQQYGTVAAGIFESDEHLDPIIDQYYQQFLMRPADPSGLAHWDQVWKQFGGPENVIAGMISSPEFFQAAGGTNSGWVSALYQRLLNRTADDQGLQYWTNLLNQNQLTRPQVVLSFEDSVENDKLLVTGFYQEYLKRDPKPDELAQAVAQMQAGASPRDIQIGIINSTEYRTTPTPPPDGTVEKLS